MLDSSLDVPDDLEQPYDPRWSPTVALALERAYALLRRRAYREALACIWPFETSARADLQRMRVHYVLGTCSARMGNVYAAIGYLDEALAIAERMDDLAACASLAYLDGPLHYEAQCVASAAEYYQIALDALNTLRDARNGATSHYARIELDILSGLASQYFLLDQHDEALRTIARARAIAPLAPEERRRAASLNWVAALIERWRGNPFEARNYAERALAEYRLVGGLNELARIELVLADIELDLAVRFPSSIAGYRELTILAQTESHIRAALAHARASGDRAAEGMTLLSYARCVRLFRPSEDDQRSIQAALEIAHNLRDDPLLGQAYSALGDDRAARGLYGSAIMLYHTALETFARTQGPALALWTWHGLRRAQEMVARP